MKKIIIIIFVLIIIISIIYNINYKYFDLRNNKIGLEEKFSNFDYNEYEECNDDINENYLIKYSSFNYTLKTLKDVIKLHSFLENIKSLDYEIIDTYIIDNNDILNIINNKLKSKSLNSKYNKLDFNNIYCILYKNFEVNSNDDDDDEKQSLNKGTKNMTYIKIILIYDNNNPVISRLFEKNYYIGKTPVYIINKNYKAFNNYFDINHHLQ